VTSCHSGMPTMNGRRVSSGNRWNDYSEARLTSLSAVHRLSRQSGEEPGLLFGEQIAASGPLGRACPGAPRLRRRSSSPGASWLAEGGFDERLTMAENQRMWTRPAMLRQVAYLSAVISTRGWCGCMRPQNSLSPVGPGGVFASRSSSPCQWRR
jgi:hypothetical protein